MSSRGAHEYSSVTGAKTTARSTILGNISKHLNPVKSSRVTEALVSYIFTSKFSLSRWFVLEDRDFGAHH